MKFIVFLSGERGISTLSHFRGSGLTPVEVVVDSVRADVAKKILDLYRGEMKITFASDVNDNTLVDYIESLELDFAVVAGFSTIFKKRLLSSTRYGILNQHAGRLPYYRGGSPLNWQIINNEKILGISVVKMDEGVDSGQVFASREFELPLNEDISHAHLRANSLFGPMTVEAIDRLLSGNEGSSNKDEDSIYWHQRNDGDGIIQWDWMTTDEIVNLVRATTAPYPSAYCFLSNRKVRVHKILIPERKYRGVPGRVFYVRGQGPLVCTRDGAILLYDYSIVPGHDSKTEDKSALLRLKTGDRLTGYAYEIQYY